MVTEATKREKTEDEKLSGKDLEQFARLMLASAVGVKPKEGAPSEEGVPDEEWQRVQTMLFGMCVMKGLHSFINDIQGDGLSQTVNTYAVKSTEFMRQISWTLREVVEKEGGTDAERKLLAFLDIHNIEPFPPKSSSVGGFLEHLMEVADDEGIGLPPMPPGLAEKLGLPPELAKKLGGVGVRTDRPPCDDPSCLACTIRRKAERAAPDEEAPVVDYYVVCENHGTHPLSNEQYTKQMLAGNKWVCPVCGEAAELDEDVEENEDS